MEQQHENNQPPKKRIVRRRVRYDRIFIALAIVIVFFILFFSCTCSCVKCVCSPSDDKETSGTEPSTTGVTENVSGTAVSIPAAGSVDDSTGGNSSVSQDASSMMFNESDIHKGSLVVVNANHQYTFPSDDVNLVSIEANRSSNYTVDNENVMLDETAVEHLNQFISEFSTLYGKNDVKVESAYRSKEEQDSKFVNGSSVFEGGYSDYHTGRSFDLCITPEDGMQSYYVASGDYAWINENAYKYGFVVRYPEGKMDSTGVNPRAYTFHYVGLPHSYYMYNNNLSLEEYVETLKSYPATSPLQVDTGDAVWTVFYTELSPTGDTVLNVPNCQEYAISGDNINGFIAAYH